MRRLPLRSFCSNFRKFCTIVGSSISPNLIPSSIEVSSSPISSLKLGKQAQFIKPPVFIILHFSSPFCTLSSSEDLILDQPSTQSVVEVSGGPVVVPVADRVYEVIVLNSNSNISLETSLDSLGLQPSTGLVDDVLRKLRYEEKLALRFFTWAGHQDGYAHERQTYNCMIDILSSTRYKLKQFGVLCDVLDRMKRKDNHSISVEALMSILKAYTEKHLTHVRRFAKKKKIKITAPEIAAFNMLLDSLCKCSLVREAEVLFNRAKKRVGPNADTYNILFFGWCRVRNPKKAMKVLEDMIEMGHAPENFTYNAGIDAFCSVGMVVEARELFEFMRTEGSTISSPTAKTYSVMIVALAKDDQMDECFRLLADMMNCGCLPDVSTYKDLIEGICLVGKIDAAYKILEEMGKKGYPPDILTYNCFLKVLCNLKKPEAALELCEKMTEAGCAPSVHTYNMLIGMFFDVKEPDRAVDIWYEMDRRGCARAVDTYGIMIDGLFCCERVEDACRLLDDVIDNGMKLPFRKFDALLLRLSETGNLHAIHRLSDHMRRFYNVAMARRFAMSQKKKSMSFRR